MRASKRNAWRGRGLDKRQARRARRRADRSFDRASAFITDEAWEITAWQSHLLQQLFEDRVARRMGMYPRAASQRPRKPGGVFYQLTVLDGDLGTMVAARDPDTGEILAVGVDPARDTPD